MTTLLWVALALLGMPLFVVLGAAALAASRTAELDPALLMVEFARLAASPNLVAIPLFVLAGTTLGQGGAPRRLVRFFNALLGWLPAGIAWVATLTCMVFTAFSGASGVTILALGGLLYPMLQHERYPERFALGLITAGGSMGLLLPPSLAVLLYGVVAQVDIGELFVACASLRSRRARRGPICCCRWACSAGSRAASSASPSWRRVPRCMCCCWNR
jgi:tripartite ATP-independent transporter DctM subunit